MSKYGSIFNKTGRVFKCKFCTEFLVKVPPGGATNSLKYHLEKKHKDEAEVVEFFASDGTKAISQKASKQTNSETPKRRRIEATDSLSKQTNLLQFGKFFISSIDKINFS